eukprot:scaffold4358_cov177-Ochromonas_danica.AAC.11
MEEEILRLRQLIASLAQEVQELKESRRFLTTTAATTTTTESLNDGDTAWMLACSALVLFMTLPGLFLFYGGMARTKNVLAIIMQVVSALDFAGGNVVHITAGMSGLMTCIYLGPRIGFGVQTFETHNVMLTAVGACMLWVGWYGFNAGSSMGADDRAGFAMLVTQISTSISGLTWMLTECLHKGHPSVLGLVSGVVAGLVCVTPASGYVDQTGGFVIGLVAGPICYLGVQLKHWAGYDDALDAFGVHGVGGIVGGLMLGFFANDRISGRDNGVFYSDTYNGDLTIGVRVSEDTEDRGDAVLFGATLVTETSNDNAAIGSIELHGQSVHPKNRN